MTLSPPARSTSARSPQLAERADQEAHWTPRRTDPFEKLGHRVGREQMPDGNPKRP
jgi:hypothetical protein